MGDLFPTHVTCGHALDVYICGLQRKKVNHRTCADLNHVFVNVNNSDRLNAANKVLGETTTTVLSIGKLSHVHMSIELELARR